MTIVSGILLTGLPCHEEELDPIQEDQGNEIREHQTQCLIHFGLEDQKKFMVL